MKGRTLLVASLLFFALFVLLAVAVTFSGPLEQADLQAALWINRLNLGYALNSLLLAASVYGREYFWVAVVGAMFVGGDRRTRVLAVGLAGLFLVGIVAGDVAKAVVMRERVSTYIAQACSASASCSQSIFSLRLPPDTDFAFPSGHALIVSVGAMYSLMTFRKKWVAGLLTVEAAVVCFSRVYLGAHYPTDVLGGVALGAAIVFGGLPFEQRYLRTQTGRLGAYLEEILGNGPLRL